VAAQRTKTKRWTVGILVAIGIALSTATTIWPTITGDKSGPTRSDNDTKKAATLPTPTQDDEALLRLHKKLEQLIAIYSLVGWKSPHQTPPVIEEGNTIDGDGNVFTLECHSIEWSRVNANTTGSLFSCFGDATTYAINKYDGTPVRNTIAPSEDYYYSFDWDSLFGYPLNVEINPEGGPCDLRDKVARDDACIQENARFANVLEICSFTSYLVRISKLPLSGMVYFVVSDGYATSRGTAGAIDRVNEWVIYLDNQGPLTMSDINKVIQLAMRSMGVPETDLTKGIPQLEAAWNRKEAVAGLLNQFAGDSQLGGIGDIFSVVSH
jgi:hypothetical protein